MKRLPPEPDQVQLLCCNGTPMLFLILIAQADQQALVESKRTAGVTSNILISSAIDQLCA
jgi:hypothetical protein